jgi:selenocysteine lyase/cysteine desulfurase
MTMERDYSADFHDFGGTVYLNCAYHGAMPRVASAAVAEALALKQTPHLIRDEYHFTYPDAYRRAVAELIGGEARDVAVANSATQGIMLAVAGLDWRSGDEVVLPAGEFPSNRFPWLSLEARGVTVREIDLGTGDDATERLLEAIRAPTRVVAASWVAYSSGRLLDIAALGRRCREVGALLVLDASQAIGGLPFSVADVEVDIVACAGYKWLLGPYGTGFAWVHPELSDRLTAPNVNWFALAGADDFNRLSDCDLTFAAGARRFDINEPGNFLNMGGGTASLRYILEVTPEAVRGHVLDLQRRLLDGLPAGMRPLGPEDPERRSNILCFSPGSDTAGDRLFARLIGERVVLSRREGALRVSPHVYNTESDIDRLLDVLNG